MQTNIHDAKLLNMALKGEHMAIQGFDHFIKNVKDTTAVEKLQEIQKRHRDQADKLSKKIQELKGNPVNSAGLSGAFQELKYRTLPKSHKKNDILDNAIEGEELGLQSLENIASQLRNHKDLMKQLIYENRKIVEKLYDMKQNNQN
jgi:bacterioferritin